METEIQYLKRAIPDLEYYQGELFSGQDVIRGYGITKRLIEEYYTDFDSFTPNGRDYINEKFFGCDEDAFKCIEI